MPVLMCPPDHFQVAYEINPWMHVSIPVDARRARRQWEELRAAYAELGVEVVIAEPVAGLPDMVFTANAAVLRGGRAVLSRFRHPERRGEEPLWRALLGGLGMRVSETSGPAFEGAGDALFLGDTLVCGSGFRSDRAAIPEVGRALGVETLAVELVDPRFYHLDTCFCPIDSRTALLAPAGVSRDSYELLRRRVERLIEVPERVAEGFACNAIRVGDTVISSSALEALREPLAGAGYRVLGLPMSEFMKAGGGVRCLSLPGVPSPRAAGLPRVREAAPETRRRAAPAGTAG